MHDVMRAAGLGYRLRVISYGMERAQDTLTHPAQGGTRSRPGRVCGVYTAPLEKGWHASMTPVPQKLMRRGRRGAQREGAHGLTTGRGSHAPASTREPASARSPGDRNPQPTCARRRCATRWFTACGLGGVPHK
jgi:hypothetical protein